MSIPALDDSTIALVKSAILLKRHAPDLWRGFIDAYAGVFQAEFDRMIDTKNFDANHALVQRSRLQFADVFGDVLQRVDEYFQAIETRERAKAAAKVNNGNA